MKPGVAIGGLTLEPIAFVIGWMAIYFGLILAVAVLPGRRATLIVVGYCWRCTSPR